MKAQDFVKQFAPKYEGSNSIPYETVLALMESFKSQCIMTHIDEQIKPKPYPIEAVLFDAILDEDKMTIDLPNDANIIDDDLHFENHSV